MKTIGEALTASADLAEDSRLWFNKFCTHSPLSQTYTRCQMVDRFFTCEPQNIPESSSTQHGKTFIILNEAVKSQK
ncbi:MAG: hypothetical protein JW808_04000 [Victivallales bacterium]|nr:hypothetical protein [Victivallales bacterium]